MYSDASLEISTSTAGVCFRLSKRSTTTPIQNAISRYAKAGPHARASSTIARLPLECSSCRRACARVTGFGSLPFVGDFERCDFVDDCLKLFMLLLLHFLPDYL